MCPSGQDRHCIAVTRKWNVTQRGLEGRMVDTKGLVLGKTGICRMKTQTFQLEDE